VRIKLAFRAMMRPKRLLEFLMAKIALETSLSVRIMGGDELMGVDTLIQMLERQIGYDERTADMDCDGIALATSICVPQTFRTATEANKLPPNIEEQSKRVHVATVFNRVGEGLIKIVLEPIPVDVGQFRNHIGDLTH